MPPLTSFNFVLHSLSVVLFIFLLFKIKGRCRYAPLKNESGLQITTDRGFFSGDSAHWQRAEHARDGLRRARARRLAQRPRSHSRAAWLGVAARVRDAHDPPDARTVQAAAHRRSKPKPTPTRHSKSRTPHEALKGRMSRHFLHGKMVKYKLGRCV